MPKKKSDYDDLPMSELKGFVDKITAHLKVSLAEFERMLELPKKSLGVGLTQEGRRVADKHIDKIIDFISDNNLFEFLKNNKEPVPAELKEVFGELSKAEIDNKLFWYDEVKKLVAAKNHPPE